MFGWGGLFYTIKINRQPCHIKTDRNQYMLTKRSAGMTHAGVEVMAEVTAGVTRTSSVDIRTCQCQW